MFDVLYQLATSPIHLILSAIQTALLTLLLSLPTYWRASAARQKASGVYYDLPYADMGDESRTLDVYMPIPTLDPPSGSRDRRFPVIIYIQDSGWTRCKKEAYAHLALELRDQGVVCIVPSFRTFPDVGGQLMADDISRILRWTSANARTYGGDPEQITVVAHSTGVQLVIYALSASEEASRCVKHIVGLSGIYDLPSLYAKLNQKGYFRASTILKVFNVMQPSGLNRYSPIHLVPVLSSLSLTPTFTFFHPAEDHLLRPTALDAYMRRLQSRGISAHLYIMEGWSRLRFLSELLGRCPDPSLIQHILETARSKSKSSEPNNTAATASILLPDRIREKSYLWRLRQSLLELIGPV